MDIISRENGTEDAIASSFLLVGGTADLEMIYFILYKKAN